jgi:hypothetical protein
MLVATVQGQEWVVSYRCYRVVGANVLVCFKEIILMPRIRTSMVKAMISGCNKMEYNFDKFQVVFMGQADSATFLKYF